MSSRTLKDIASALVFALLLFLPAGTFAWPQAWVFLALFFGCSIALGVWLHKTDPALLDERRRSPLSAAQTPRDRAIMAAMLVCFVAWFVFIGLDARRFGWSSTPLWAQVLGAALIVVAFIGWVAVLRANTFASSNIRLQQARGQTVISTGPYAMVRHPMYAYALFFMLGIPLLLGSLWSLLGLLAMLPLLAARTLGEEAMLRAGLAGYREYMAKVRYRLVPGVW
jgi:protein-S-isoprenylcysteine O-methyltransferase Ste14